jgi:putative oxidoreductase
MKIVTITARSLLGLIFVVFGLNMILHFFRIPPPHGPLGGPFLKSLFLSHFMFAVAMLEIVGGALCLVGKYVPLGLVLLGPIIVSGLLYHILMDPQGVLPALVAGVLSVFLLWAYRPAFAGLVKA